MIVANPIESAPDAYALRCIPEAAAREHQWLAYHCDEHCRKLCIATPRIPGKLLQKQADSLLRDSVQPESGWAIHWNCIADVEQLAKSIQRAYETSHVLEDISASCSMSSDDTGAQLGDDQWPIGRWLDALINDAVQRRASDIHAQLDGHEFIVHYRIDGVMQNRLQVSCGLWRSLLARIKVLAKLDLTEHRRPQEGAFERIVRGYAQPIRVAIMPHARSEKVTLRIQRSLHSLPSLAECFVLKPQCRLVLDALAQRQGLILVAGATGSGKTTTLYSCLMEWLAMGLHLITLEDPIEVSLSGVCQSGINPSIGYSFAAALRAALRHDPDGLLVGEIRDDETCALSIRAALSGHPVLASVHANDAVGVVQRLVSLGATITDLQETVRIIIVQRLARKLCHCQQRMQKHVTICARCKGTGYYGRVAAVEIARTGTGFFDHDAGWAGVRNQLHREYLKSLSELVEKNHIDHHEQDRIVQSLREMDAKVSCKSG